MNKKWIGVLAALVVIGGGAWFATSAWLENGGQRTLFNAVVDKVVPPPATLPPETKAAYIKLFLQDQMTLRDLQVLSSPAESDAGPWLNPRIFWIGEKLPYEWKTAHPKPSINHSPELREALPGTYRDSEDGKGRVRDWDAQAALVDKHAIDLSALATLEKFDHWDIWKNSPIALTRPYDSLDAPMPNFMVLQLMAGFDLAKGLVAGDARPAARRVRHLVKLLYSTEHIIGALLASATLNIERKAYEEAVRRKLPVEGWTPVDKPTADALARVIKFHLAIANLSSEQDLFDRFVLGDEAPVGKCAGLADGLPVAAALHPVARGEYADRYAQLDKALNTSRCRLSMHREGWLSGRFAFMKRDGKNCRQFTGEGYDACRALGEGDKDLDGALARVLAGVAGPEIGWGYSDMVNSDAAVKTGP